MPNERMKDEANEAMIDVKKSDTNYEINFPLINMIR